MHLAACNCPRTLKALGFDPTGLLTSALTSMLSPAGMTAGGTGMGSQAPNVTAVTTSVSTQVSPDISPTFVQQQSPTNSPVGVTHQTGAVPGFDYASGYAPTGTPLIPSIPQVPLNMNFALAAGVGLLAFAFVLKKKKPARKGRA